MVLLGAGYLSAAALMAIPELDDARSIPESVSVEKLRERLAGIQIGKDELEQSFPEDAHLQKDPLAELESVLQSETGADPPSAREPASQPLAPATLLPAPESTPATAPATTPETSSRPTPDSARPASPGAQPRAWNRVRDWFGSDKEEGHDARGGGGGDPPASASASAEGEPGGNTLPPV